jgi:CzcA family heavy metal efflux pump
VTAWLFDHRRSVLFLLVAASLLGAVTAWRLPVGLFPVIDFPRVVVSVDAGDRPVERMVSEITRPLEESLRGVPDVKSLRSTSSRGSAEVSINFSWGAPMATAALQVQSAVNAVLPDLPAGTRFTVRRMDPTVFPVLGISMTSEKRDLVALRDLAQYTLRPVLAALPDVAQVEILGGQMAEYQVQLDPQRLAGVGLGLTDISQALASHNVYAATGKLEDRYRLYLTLTDGRLTKLDDLRALVLKSGPGGVVTLGSVARVETGVEPAWTRVTADGRDAVLLNIRQSRGANAVSLVKAVRAALSAHADELPGDVHIGTFYDQSELVQKAVGSVMEAILIGAVLAGLVVLLFLRNARLTLLVAIVLPIVLAMTSLLLQAFGMSFNIMTLGGVAAAVGLIVDDAVVMVEHLVRRLQEAREPNPRVVLSATAEMLRPMVGSTLATVVVFLPLALLSGVTGGFFRALALTMSAALLVSLAVALLAVPLITLNLVTDHGALHAEPADTWMSRLRNAYVRLAERLLSFPSRVMLAAAVVAALGGLAFWHLPTGFMPKMDEGGFILDYRAAPGASLSETDRLLRQVEGFIRALPDVDTYSRRTGVQLGGGLTEANSGDYFIKLRQGGRRPIEEVMADLRGQIESHVPGLDIETAQLMEDLIGDLTAVPQPVEIKLFGADLIAVRAHARDVAARLEKVRGVVEVRDGTVIAGDAIDIHLDPVRVAMEGLDAEAIGRQLESLIAGSQAGTILVGEKLIGIRLRSPQSLRDRVETIAQLQLRSPDGHLFALRRVADVRIVAGQAQVVREDLAQMVAVTARLEDRDLGSAMQDIQQAVRDLHLPASVRVEYGGLYREQQASFQGLAMVFLTALLLVTALLLYLYEQWRVVIAILATITASVSAVFLGLWVTGTELDVSAVMGLTMVVGIVAEVAIFFFAEMPTDGEVDARQVVLAGSRRLRPILMTSLIAILALMPLALGFNGASMQTPLAIAIISGLVAAVPLVLLFMPAVYWRLGRSRPALHHPTET